MCSSGTFLSYIKGVKYFHISRGNMGFLSKDCSGKGPHLTLSGESRGCSRVMVGCNPGDPNSGEANPGDSPRSVGSVVSFPEHFSGQLAHICVHTHIYTCTHTHTHTNTHTHTGFVLFPSPGNSHFKSTCEALQR